MRSWFHIDVQTRVTRVKTGTQATISIMDFDQQIITRRIIQPVKENGAIWRIFTNIKRMAARAAIRILSGIGCLLYTSPSPRD